MTHEELQQLYQRVVDRRSVPDRAACVAPEALQALLDRTGPEAERLRALDHVMSCRACHAEFALLHSVVRAAQPGHGRYYVALGLAAAVLLLVGGGVLWQTSRRNTGEVMRGVEPELRLVQPAGVVRAGGSITLVWQPAPEARGYEVELLDAAGRVVFSGTTTDTTFALPDKLPHSPGGDYSWSARATLADGTQLRSTLLRFTLHKP